DPMRPAPPAPGRLRPAQGRAVAGRAPRGAGGSDGGPGRGLTRFRGRANPPRAAMGAAVRPGMGIPPGPRAAAADTPVLRQRGVPAALSGARPGPGMGAALRPSWQVPLMSEPRPGLRGMTRGLGVIRRRRKRLVWNTVIRGLSMAKRLIDVVTAAIALA